VSPCHGQRGDKKQTGDRFLNKKKQRHKFGDVSQMRVTTLETLAGRVIEDTVGFARGHALWSRRISKNSTAGHRALEHMTQAEVACGLADVREKAEAAMMKNAQNMGADSIIGLRIDMVELGNDMYQAIAYGTAVRTVAVSQTAPTIHQPVVAGTFGHAANDADAIVLPFQRRAMGNAAARVH
jgi:uncharacterized protein YbjQ (UPF0145 family)